MRSGIVGSMPEASSTSLRAAASGLAKGRSAVRFMSQRALEHAA
jgi:hypothetical protein